MSKILLSDGVSAEFDEFGTLYLSWVVGGPMGQERERFIGISPVGAQTLLDLLANGQRPTCAAPDALPPTSDAPDNQPGKAPVS